MGGDGATTSAGAPRAVVIGAGPAGLATALALRRVGLEAVVFERQQQVREAGTALTLWPNAMRALGAIGVAEAVSAHGLPLEGLAMRSSGGRMLSLVGREVMESRFGGPGLALLRADLMAVLLGALGGDGVHYGARCVGVRPAAGGAAACFADGREVRGDLVIGADGMRSAVRAALVGGRGLRHSGYSVVRGVTGFDLGPAPGQLSLGRGRQFGTFPMTRQRVYWFASLGRHEAGRLATGDVKATLAAWFADWHQPIPRLVEGTSPRHMIVTEIHDRRPLRRWGRGAATLVGDAAHPSGPALGQGTCQAFEDAVVLADSLRSTGDVLAALRRYERRRRRRANWMTVQAHRMGRAGQWRSLGASWLRDEMIARTPESTRLRQLGRLFDVDLACRLVAPEAHELPTGPA